MKILVCVKQVPDMDAPIMIDAYGRWDGPALAFRLNRYDEYALEEALLLKEALHNVSIDAVSVGPARAQTVIRRALELGVDTGVHIEIGRDGYVPPEVIAAHIQEYAQDGCYDLIICGAMSEDCMHAQVGPLLAEMMGLPSLTAVIAVQMHADGLHVDIEQEIEGGIRRRFTLALPAVISVQTGINHPRYPTLTNVLRAKRQAIERIVGRDIQANARFSFRSAPEGKQGVMITGGMREQAKEMLRILHEHAIL
ncbi:MAG TPA: electron transfer flavoprotein subunit beta/FixA family protein [Deltaproteobacteria bacterium]|nr:electron transfer flavoprotein subunit beta/FixA family protein [Deltaproteobacteria bacterium]